MNAAHLAIDNSHLTKAISLYHFLDDIVYNESDSANL